MVSMTLGLPYDSKHKSEYGSVGIGGVPQDSYNHQVEIDILDENRSKVIRTLSVEVSSLTKNDVPVLLGVHQFLEAFHLSIDYRSQTMQLNW